MSPKNPFLNPPPEGAAEQTPSMIEVINAISTMLSEQRNFDRQSVTKFRKLFNDTGLKKWVVLAGVGGAVELVRLGWDILQYFLKHFGIVS